MRQSFRSFLILANNSAKKKRPAECDTASLNCLEYDWAMPHTRSRRNGRQEGRECSYYNLHCNLNNTLFHFLIKSVILCFRFSLCSRIRRIASHWGLALPHRLSMGSGTDVKSLATFSSGPDPSERPRRNARRNALAEPPPKFKDSASAAPVSSPPAESPS